MLDVNLGNKTLVIGVLIAMILSYGMVNFDSGTPASAGIPAIRTAQQDVASAPMSMANATPVPERVPGHVLKAPASVSVAQPEADASDVMLDEYEPLRRKQRI